MAARGTAVSRRAAAAIVVGGFFVTPARMALASATAEESVSPQRLCAEAIDREELRTAVPAKLLHAIAIAESGRYDRTSRAIVAWPWTVHAEGRGQYFARAGQAAAAVRALLARGVDSVDVGCMQINLHYHPDAFATLDDAFDPRSNVAYAAAFLSDLAARTGSWFAAIGRYHSSTPDHGRRYRTKVLRIRKAQQRHAVSARGDLPDITTPAAIVRPPGNVGSRPDLPVVIRGPSGGAPPVRLFAADRNALPMILRGAGAGGKPD